MVTGGVQVVPASTGDTLPRTGGNSATAVLIGGLLVVLGLLLVRYGRSTDT